MELKVIEQVQKLTWNFEDVKAELTRHIEKYAGLVVNEENLQDMEKTQKEIASLRIKVGKFRMAVKKEMEKPFDVFDLQVKELSKLIESAEIPIKNQLEKYEVMRREAKTIEVQGIIDSVSAELGLHDCYKEQIIIADKYLNRTQKIKDTKEDIQARVCWFLDVQAKDIADEANRIEKVNMAHMMVEFMSKDLVTPLTFADIENKIEQLNITELRTYIENQVTIRKEREERAKQLAEQQLLERQERERQEEARRIEREERAAQQALERAEQERIAEIQRQERIEQERVAEIARQEQELLTKDEVVVEQIVEQQPVVEKKYNARITMYGITEDYLKDIEQFLKDDGIKFGVEVKEANK